MTVDGHSVAELLPSSVRILGVGDANDLGAMYMALEREGHDCQVLIRDADSQDTLSGLVPRCRDLEAGLRWVRDARDEGVVLFETAHDGALQDELRAQGLQVIGGSALGDRLESEREFGQQCLAEAGMQTAAVHPFGDFEQAIQFVRSARRRFVFKVCGNGFASYRNYLGELEDGEDMVAYLVQQARRLRDQAVPPFLLMEYLEGVEVGVGAYFDGTKFLTPACLDWEHKRFFPSDLGELTGEMGTLVSYEHGSRLFEASLARLAPRLAAAGHVGYVNVNLIVNQAGVWPLELTCRFGYPGFAILSALQPDGWGDLIQRMLTRAPGFAALPGFAVGVVLTVPPFPYAHGYAELSKGMPLTMRELSAEDRTHLHYGELALEEGQLVTAGHVGYLMVVTGRGATARDAQRAAYERVRKVHAPNLRYRTDIGARFIAQDCDTLRKLGFLP